MNWTLEEALAYYKRMGAPGDQNALIQLLKEIQEHMGCVPGPMVTAAAEFYGIKEALLLALIRRVKTLRLGAGDLLEVCAGPNCGKSAHLAALAETLAKESGGKLTVRFTPCMRLCGKGPNIRWNGQLHHRADESLLRRLAGSEKPD